MKTDEQRSDAKDELLYLRALLEKRMANEIEQSQRFAVLSESAARRANAIADQIDDIIAAIEAIDKRRKI